MSKRLNLYVHDEFYDKLLSHVGRGHLSSFIEESIMPLIQHTDDAIEIGYRKMSQDKLQMQEAVSMANNCIGDVGNEPWFESM